MELSSFQLELFRAETQGDRVDQVRTERSRAISLEPWSPHIAVVTNITPNHLDRHPSMEDYVGPRPLSWTIRSRETGRC